MQTALALALALGACSGCTPVSRLGEPDLVVDSLAPGFDRFDVAAGFALVAGTAGSRDVFDLEVMCIPGPEGATDCGVFQRGDRSDGAFAVVRFLPD